MPNAKNAAFAYCKKCTTLASNSLSTVGISTHNYRSDVGQGKQMHRNEGTESGRIDRRRQLCQTFRRYRLVTQQVTRTIIRSPERSSFDAMGDFVHDVIDFDPSLLERISIA